MPKRRRTQAVASAAFGSSADVVAAMRRLLEMGISRDLIEVATDPATAKREFPRRAGHRTYEVLADAGRGALVGILISIVIALVMIFVADVRYAGPLSLVQLLGPNVGTLAGAMLGALWGLLRPRPLHDYYCRVKETGGILVLVHCKTAQDAENVAGRLKALGGRAEHVDRTA